MKLPKALAYLIGLLLVVLVVFLGLLSWNAYAQHYKIGVAVRDRDVITVDGSGKATAKPDIALVSLGVLSDNTTVKGVQTDNTKKMNDIIAAVKALGVSADDITTTNYTLSPKINWNNNKQDIIGYTLSQQVSIKVRDLDKVGDVLGKVGELGANQVGGIQFTIDDPKAVQAEARLKAIEDARKKAEVLAKELGLTLVKVVTFSENGYNPGPYPVYAKTMDVAMGAGAMPTPQIETGTQDVVSNVNVTFEVR
jgi:uncharacterized protein